MSERPTRPISKHEATRQRREHYAQTLKELYPFTCTVDRASTHRANWHFHFAQRIGPTFNGRIILDLGCADATFLAQIASKYPDSAFIGIDWKFKMICDGGARLAQSRAQNISLIRARASDLATIFAPGELAELWVFHPEPCDRAEESDNRLLNEPFLLGVHPLLQDGGRVSVKTDHVGYFQWLLTLLGQPLPGWMTDANLPGAPARFQRRDLFAPDKLPVASQTVLNHFQIASVSFDYWSDESVLAATASRMFAGELTPFERRFRTRKQPIFFLELCKHASMPGRI